MYARATAEIFMYRFSSYMKQTYLIFVGKLKTPHFSPGEESLECQLFALDDIPFDSLAFSSMLVTLKLVRHFLCIFVYLYISYHLFWLDYIECLNVFSS